MYITTIGTTRGDKGAVFLKQILAYLVLFFERRFPKQNAVACLKSKYFDPSQNFGLACYWLLHVRNKLSDKTL